MSVKPSGNLMIDDRDTISDHKIEREERRHRRQQITTAIREFLFSRCQENKTINLVAESKFKLHREKMLNE